MTAGRNDPCPCGSGKKAKICCGAIAAGDMAASLAPADAGFVAGTYEIDGGYTPAILCVSHDEAGHEVRHFAMVKKGKAYSENEEIEAAEAANADLSALPKAIGTDGFHRRYANALSGMGYYFARDGSKFW